MRTGSQLDKEAESFRHGLGPCLEAFRTGEPVEGTDLALLTARWPHFAPAVMSVGFNTASAVPMRLRGNTIGALNLFQAGIETFNTRQVNVARVLADMAAIAIVNHGSLRQQEVLSQQLEGALNSRLTIDQPRDWSLSTRASPSPRPSTTSAPPQTTDRDQDAERSSSRDRGAPS